MNKVDSYYEKMTKTPVSKLIVILGIPTTISMLITNIYNLVDTYFVGTLGENQQAATSILFTLQCIIQAFAFMLGHGSGTFLSKALADKDTKTASKYISTAFFVGGLIGLILMIFGLIFINPFMNLLGSNDVILPYSRQYGIWVLISAPFMITSLVLNNNLRYEGKAAFAMIGLCAGSLLNIFGDYLFVSVMSLGVFGAGMSTAISQIISFFILLILYIKYAKSKISIKSVSNESFMYLNIFKAGLPSLIRQGLTAISSGILNNLITKPIYTPDYDVEAAAAAMGIVNRFTSFVMCVGLGIGQGFQPVASFNYQVKEYDRVKKGLIFTLIFGICLVSVLALFGLVIPEQIMYLFQQSEEGRDVVNIGINAMRIASVGVLFMPISVCVNMLYQSIRKSFVASFLSLLRSGLVFIPILLILQFSGLGLTGIKCAQPLSDIITSIISIPFIVYFIVKTPSTSIENDKKSWKLYKYLHKMRFL